MVIHNAHTISCMMLAAVFNLYMFYLGVTAPVVYRKYTTACRVMHGASVALCAIGSVCACAMV